MNILHTLTGPALVGSLSDGLRNVKSMFERGPDAALNYGAEFKREHAEARQRAMQMPSPASPAPSGPSM